MMNRWPLQRDCMSFYGDPRQRGWLQVNTVGVKCPWPIHCGRVPVDHITIHKKCAASLTRTLQAIWVAVGQDIGKIKQLRYDVFDGSYNLRVMRGGNALSMHSYACAIDWDAADNPFHVTKHLFSSDSLIVVKFKEEGWLWGGDWSLGSVDAMHVQAARIHE